MSASERLAALRARMAVLHYDAFIVPSEDAHMSEYVAACDERRAFISGFDGSAGTVVVTHDAALCWTDGRYFVQAQSQLDPACFRMMKLHEDLNVDQWLAENMPLNSIVAVDGATISVGAFERLKACLRLSAGRRHGEVAAPGVVEPSNGPDTSKSVGTGPPTSISDAQFSRTGAIVSASDCGIKLVSLPPGVRNLVDDVWGDHRPSPPMSVVFVHPVKFSGESVQAKLSLVHEAMRAKEVTHLVVSGLDEVAWLLNLRGADVEFNPVFWSYVMVSVDRTVLYTNGSRLSEEARLSLQSDNISVASYDALCSDVARLPDGSVVWIDPSVCNYSICKAVEDAVVELGVKIGVVKAQGPIPLAKAKKNKTELDGIRAAHLRDAVAVVKFLAWLEDQVVTHSATPTECEAAEKLDSLRAQQDRFVSLSFPTISSFGSNAAIIHYRPVPETCARISCDAIYLVDSGGQYLDGTTDVTRTMHFGTPSEWEKECFTRVLSGHIALDTAVFPKGTTGQILDAFARRPLWKAGLDYKHGTGHGVGCFLNVHEGPHMLSFKPAAQATALEPGFLSSNEPGYYEPQVGEQPGFGIRIENICVVVPFQEKLAAGNLTGGRPFYAFEHMTIVPLQTKMMKPALMTQVEIEWVNSYHAECREKLEPLLPDDPKALAWLLRNTEPIRPY